MLQGHALPEDYCHFEFLAVLCRIEEIVQVCLVGRKEICRFHAFMALGVGDVLFDGVFSVWKL